MEGRMLKGNTKTLVSAMHKLRQKESADWGRSVLMNKMLLIYIITLPTSTCSSSVVCYKSTQMLVTPKRFYKYHMWLYKGVICHKMYKN